MISPALFSRNGFLHASRRLLHCRQLQRAAQLSTESRRQVYTNDMQYMVHSEFLGSPTRPEVEPTAPWPSKNSFSDEGEKPAYGEVPRTSILMELTDRVGILSDVLRHFWKFDVNICRIESRPNWDQPARGRARQFDFFVDIEGSISDPNVSKLLKALSTITDKLLILDEKKVHWFPRHVSELDLVADRTLSAGTDLESDHPGFQDPVSLSTFLAHPRPV